jgi:uncharacterized protein YhbP (UPF0306 family)
MAESTPRNPRDLALAYLANHQVMTLATTGPRGVWAAAVFYVNDGFDLIFLSAGHTRHAQNMTAVPHIAATIQEDYRDWQQIQGIQLEGSVSLLTMFHGKPQSAVISRNTRSWARRMRLCRPRWPK